MYAIAVKTGSKMQTFLVTMANRSRYGIGDTIADFTKQSCMRDRLNHFVFGFTFVFHLITYMFDIFDYEEKKKAFDTRLFID